MAFPSKYFRQEAVGNVRADVDLVIRQLVDLDAAPAAKRARRASRSAAAPAADGAAAADDAVQLASFPAHNFILDNSEYFMRQQAQCWQPSLQPPVTPNTRACRGSSSSSSAANRATAPERPKIYLTVGSAEQLPAAEAFIAAMYGVPDAISGLEQQQVVHVVVIADMVHAEAAGQQALQALQAAAESEAGLEAAALEALAGLPVWPACLLQLLPSIVKHAACCRDSEANLAAVTAADAGGRIQKLLVAALGDLQAVWSEAQRQALLLALPLPAMQLLLSSDQLRVPSEDTVLYTAKRYVKAQKTAAKRAAAKAGLAPLVRAPQLSLFALSCAALPADSEQQLLGSGYAQQLRLLLPLRRIASAEELASEMLEFEGAPDSWRLGPRQVSPLGDGVRLEWRLPVQQLRQACRDSFEQQQVIYVESPGSSPPLGGVGWRLVVDCVQQEGGTVVGLYAGPVLAEVPNGVYFRFRATASWSGVQINWRSNCLNYEVYGDKNYFQLQPMAGGGWDEAAWAAAGLPTAGEMCLELCLHSVQ
uniref:BACK domain-containing protein n=1 Tax=Tetradesmus obliquus TaxID=3088 RepID=A0A383W9A1_TETOB|eukprot:jgi/Sobl393_1/3746/SZX73266.1